MSLFYCYEKVFKLMKKIWMIGKHAIKHHYLKKKTFTVTWKILVMKITRIMEKELVKILK